jgi:hypothetical protein
MTKRTKNGNKLLEYMGETLKYYPQERFVEPDLEKKLDDTLGALAS